MITGIDINQRIEFVSSQDKTDPKTIFVLRPLAGAEALEFLQQGNAIGEKLILSSSYVSSVLNKSIVEIKNAQVEKSKEEIIASLPATVVIEIIAKLGEISHLTEVERKN